MAEKSILKVGVAQFFEMLFRLYQITRRQVNSLNLWSNQENDVGGACSTYGGDERCIQGFGGETWGKETTWKS
jgi:hypothetical protein